MESHPQSASPLRGHAEMIIGISRYAIPAAAILFAMTLPYTPRSMGYWMAAMGAGAVSFPLLWWHWRRPRNWLFALIVALLVVSGKVAQRICFPEATGSLAWLAPLQYASLYVLAEFLLIWGFRDRLRQSMD